METESNAPAESGVAVETKMPVGKLIRTLRKKKGIRQQDLAVKAQLKQSSISCIERGLRIPNTDKLKAIVDGLSISFDDFMGMVGQEAEIPPVDPKEETVGMRIRNLRRKAKMHQRDIADAAKIMQANLSRIENGKVRPRIKTLTNIAAALGVEVSALYS